MYLVSSTINRILLLSLMLLPQTIMSAQSSSWNYVQTKTFLDEDGQSFLRHIDYYNELGVVAETVDVGINPSQTPVVTRTEYNSQLKPAHQWAPVPASGLDYLETFCSKAQDTYNSSLPYATTFYDDFQEVESSWKPGDAWEERPVTVTRSVVPSGTVRKYTVDSNGNLVINANSYYSYGLLTSATTTDEDGKNITLYTDFHENTVMERRGSGEDATDTYYVYDDYGFLRYVLPPMCQQCANTSEMSKYWYKYTYDDRGRCIEKQLPGCEPVKYWYDNANRIVSEQDGHLREQGLYRNYRYDGIGRVTLQTICRTRGIATESDATLVEVKNYYDDYSCCQEFAQLFPQWASTINSNSSSAMVARGRPTATLHTTSDGNSYFELYCYDTKGHMSYKLSAYDNKWMKTSTMTYNFVGDLGTIKEKVYTCSNGQINEIANRRTINQYHAGTRLLKKTTVTHLDKNGKTSSQVICQPTYDVFGNITANDRPGTAADMTYTYDTLHGWLKGISSPSGFSQQLLRETAQYAQYSGNIGSMQWRNTTNGELHQYNYTYDGLGRLTDAQYTSYTKMMSGFYDERVSYDANGSITSLLRSGMKNDGTYGLIDDLTISYDGNRLMKVTDDAEAVNYNGALDFHDAADVDVEYAYDSNGALTRDDNRGINSISYDYGHHPEQIVMVAKDGTSGILYSGIQKRQMIIQHDYTPDGRKLSTDYRNIIDNGRQMMLLNKSEKLYIDGLILRDGVPFMWQFDGGYVELNANGTPTSWNYYITDYLGSTRKVVDSNNNVKETINYYPFGSEMRMQDPAQMAGDTWQPYRFTGKELDKQNGLNMYDFGARLFDVAGVPMWTSVDPLAEKYYNVTPYSYCMGNPVMLVDPEGKEPTEDEAARIAAHVYGDKKDDILTGGWRVSSRDFGISNKNGLKSQVYEKVNDDGEVSEYVYATAGTETDDINDYVADAAQVVGLSSQYHMSALNAQKISNQLGEKELNFVGHSLGGGEAALNSLLTYGDGKGRLAFTFNAAGVSVATKIREGGLGMAIKSEKSINAYITVTDPLNHIQNGSMLLPSVNGNRNNVLPKKLNGHSIDNFY